MKKFTIMILFCSLFTFSCGSGNYAPLEVVEEVNINRYLGKWYEIARLPNSFQKNCYRSTAEYTLIDSETIRVVNSCFEDSVNGELDQATGKAFVVEGSNNAKLKVQFFWPFKGDYWIIDLDRENYNYAVVGSPSREYLWILAREIKLPKEILSALIDRANKKGFDTTKLIFENY
jgi:apolipoprotein D and lipocalin family protein